MFPKKNRLAKPKDIALVYSKGRSFFGPYFTVKFLNRLESYRFTVVVSTKVSKKANIRNAYKRHIREVLRIHKDELRVGDYIITVKQNVKDMDVLKLRTLFEEFLRKVQK